MQNFGNEYHEGSANFLSRDTLSHWNEWIWSVSWVFEKSRDTQKRLRVTHFAEHWDITTPQNITWNFHLLWNFSSTHQTLHFLLISVADKVAKVHSKCQEFVHLSFNADRILLNEFRNDRNEKKTFFST